MAFLLTFLVFAPALRFGFLSYDDPQNFLNNLHYRGLSFAHLKWMFTSADPALYIPFSWVTSGLDYVLYGMNPHGYHFTNVLIHAANAALFAVLLRGFLRREHAVLAAALFWAVHPLRVEAVAWLSERREVLSGFFFLATLIAYRRSRLRWSTLFYACGLLSKQSAVPLPLLLVLWEYPRVRWREKVPYFLLAISMGLVAVWSQRSVGAAFPLQAYGLGARLVLALSNIFTYLQETVLPWRLSPYNELPSAQALFGAPFLLRALGTLALLALAWARSPRLWKGLAAFVLFIAPVSGLFQSGTQSVIDRYTYLPGLILAAGAGLWLDRHDFGRPAKLATAAGLLLLTCVTLDQMRVWSSDERLFERVLEIDPGSSFGNNNWGTWLAERGRVKEALPYFERAVARSPTNDNALANLRRARRELSRASP